MNETKKAAPGVEVREREDAHAEGIGLSDEIKFSIKMKAELALRDEVIAGMIFKLCKGV